MAIYKEKEFAEFIKLLGEGQVCFWHEIAEAIGVDPDTVTKWKRTPEAVKARQKGIDNALKQMEMAGKKDWRMWEAKLKMLGLNPAQRHEVKLDDTRKNILERYGLPHAGQAKTAEGRSPQDTT